MILWKLRHCQDLRDADQIERGVRLKAALHEAYWTLKQREDEEYAASAPMIVEDETVRKFPQSRR